MQRTLNSVRAEFLSVVRGLSVNEQQLLTETVLASSIERSEARYSHPKQAGPLKQHIAHCVEQRVFSSDSK